MLGFGARKQPSPPGSGHLSSAGTSAESRPQPHCTQRVWMLRLKLGLNAVPSTSLVCGGRKMLRVAL